MAKRSEYRDSFKDELTEVCERKVSDIIVDALKPIIDDIETEVNNIKDICESADNEDLDDMNRKMLDIVYALEELSEKLY